MSHQVNIHIRHKPVESDEDVLSCGERLINLDPTRTVLQIGRASKSPSKGLLGAIDNAWFDSPVMSRNHAEIIYSPVDNLVQIRDLGSMHGTFLNGEKLGEEAKPLNSNDQIVFGIGVRRGVDLFQPCHFEVNYEVIPWKRPNSYTVPDSSDDEDDEDEGYHFNDTEMSEEASSPGDTSIEMTRSSPTSKTVDAIDLTVNDTPSPRLKPTKPSDSNDERIEEDEYTPKSPVLDSIVRDSRDGVGLKTNPQKEAVHPRKTSYTYTFNYDSNDDEDEDMLSTQSDSDESDIENASELEDFRDFEDLPSHDDVDSEDESMSDASEESEVQVLLTESREALNEIPSSYPSVGSGSSRASSPAPQATLVQTLSQTRTPFDNDADIPESHVRTQIHTSEEVIALDQQNNDDEDEVDDDDDRSVGLSEAANEGLQTLYKDGLLKKEPGTNPTGLIGSGGSYDEFSKSHLDSYYATCTPAYDASPFGYYNPHINRASISARQCGNSRNDYYSLTKPRSPFASYYGREASPSSVAMARPPHQESYADQTPETLSARSLGDKTGKHAFFEAREENKVQFQAHVDDEESQVSQFSPLSMTTRPSRAIKFTKPLAKFVQPILPIKYHGNGIDHGFVINDRPVSNIESSKDRPSIHPYYFSSDASSRAVESPVLERHPIRSGLSIDDIIDSSPVGKKRKADEISHDELIKNEVRDWVSGVNDSTKPQAAVVAQEEIPGPESSAHTTHTIHHAQKVQSDVQLPTADAATQQNKLAVLTTTTNDPEHRPVKRLKMRKFVEAVGYFALGGAAVGAGLFSALVATAPEFV
ncbi:uncharacterized protein EAF02_005825 [Botrytis sinoallii]|uniref:uncharacterized protein n=1 Tax=Botrytis sinoallii TaxID=1463999 RepID=UPI0018FF2B6F|nr:uncharacterized protein EAF02_005825 [Botrytis sinoallii]KAF7882462.1 hypothetical protein EAF02_005825 [Botrytis sinoallii]